MKRLLILLLLAISDHAGADEGVDITDQGQVSELNNLQEDIDAVSEAIMKCMDTGQEHNVCMCRHQTLIIRFNTTAKNLFSTYPELEKRDLVRFRAPDGTWVSQSLEGIRKQAGRELSCP